MVLMIVMIVMTFFPTVDNSAAYCDFLGCPSPCDNTSATSATCANVKNFQSHRVENFEFFAMASEGTCSFHRSKGTSIQRTRSIGGQMSGVLKLLPASGSVFRGFQVPLRNGDTAPESRFIGGNFRKGLPRHRRSNRVIGRHMLMFDSVWFDSLNSDVAVPYSGVVKSLPLM
jgi:hypothetical protein